MGGNSVKMVLLHSKKNGNPGITKSNHTGSDES